MHPIKLRVKRERLKFSINLRLYSLDNIKNIVYNLLNKIFPKGGKI